MSKLLKVNEIAEMLGVDKKRIYVLKRKDHLPFVRVGSSLRFDELEVQKWIEQNKGKEIK